MKPLARALIAGPAALIVLAITVCAVRTSMPFICAQSIPVMRYNSVRRSKAGAFLLLFLLLGLGPIGCVVRSSLDPNDSRCFRNCRSQSAIFS